MNPQIRKNVKVVVTGGGGVGKTSFLNRLVYDNFNMKSELTRGIDFFSKNMNINGSEINFVMWDFAGQRQFRTLLEDFVDGSIAIFILFDLTRITSLQNVEEWLERLREFSTMPTLILGTKYDLVDNNMIVIIDNYLNNIIERSHININYLKISSKTGYNVKEAFDILVNRLSYHQK
ncbi:MAG: GTP-binding protein [Candidatus Lokiarchaeota archaeon]|nr:GTP-binding protein [Candidatus Lokiarchaeota archaeon]